MRSNGSSEHNQNKNLKGVTSYNSNFFKFKDLKLKFTTITSYRMIVILLKGLLTF
jgi:hypothetical protein